MILVSFVFVCWCIAGDPHASPSHHPRTMCHRYRQAYCSESSAASLVIKALKEPETDRKKKLRTLRTGVIFPSIILLRLLG
ncbi:hypothetical protein Bca4012_062745 [Brassica carinata]